MLIADDNQIVRAGLVALLEASGEMEVTGEAGDGREAIALATEDPPDVALLDVRMPVLDGVGALAELSRLTKVIMLTHTEDPEIVRAAIRGGAVGYLVHSAFTPQELAAGIRGVLDGKQNPLSPVAVQALMESTRRQPASASPRRDPAARYGLTTREVEVLALVARGMSNAAIAHELFLAEKTVKNHVNHIYDKLGVRTRAAAIARWNGEYAED